MAPEPYSPPVREGWDGKHYSQESEEARGRLDRGLGKLGGTTTLPTFTPDTPLPTKPLPKIPGAGVARP
jgi:hypothetical protein